MPTGYTAPIKDGISFNDFVLQCSRAMGACLSQRDDTTTPFLACDEVPEFYGRNIAEAEAEVQRIKDRTQEQIDAEYKAAVAQAEVELEKASRETADLRNKYNRMRTQVSMWKPPTAEHIGLKKFMLEQIESSINFDCEDTRYYTESLTSLVTQTPIEWHAKQLANAIQSLARHKQSLLDEQERVAKRNDWKRELCESLGVTFPMGKAAE